MKKQGFSTRQNIKIIEEASKWTLNADYFDDLYSFIFGYLVVLIIGLFWL